MMFPDDLPGTLDAVRVAPSPTVAALDNPLSRVSRSPAELLGMLGDAPLRPDGVKLDRWAWHPLTRRTEQFAILDRYFGVFRVTAGTPEMFGHSAAIAYRTLLADTVDFGTDLDAARWNELCGGLEATIRFAGGSRRVGAPRFAVPPGHRPRDPHRRWRSGHQVFFPLIQAILVGLRCLAAAILAGDGDGAKESAVFTTDVMRASARALEYAADFSPAAYAREVRPSMMPPGTPQGLSGLMSADHHRMIGCFHEIRPMVAHLEGELREFFAEFVRSVEDTYAAHVHVCDRFNGNHMVSLRMSHSNSMTASDVLAQMGRARVRMLRPT